MTTVDGVMSNIWRYVKAYPEFVCGTGNDVFAKQLGRSFWGDKNKNNGLHFRDAKRQFNTAFEKTLRANELNIKNNGGFFKNMGNSFTSMFTDIGRFWKSGAKLANKTGKTGLKKFGIQMKGIGKVLGKRMPLLGTLMMVGMELPNILRATTNEGVLTGAGETGKAAAKIGISTLFGALGTALCPVCPFAGAILGYTVGDFVGRFIMGKTYTEKKEALAADKVQQAVNNQQTAITTDATSQQTALTTAAASQIPPGMEYGNFIQPNMTKDDIMKLQQQYYAMANGNSGNNFFTNPGGLNAIA